MPSNFDEAFAAVQSLAKDFDAHKGHYLSPAYKEAEVRNDHIDKFLVALGWDPKHDTQKNPGAQEVKIEPGVSTGGSERRADYAFYIAPRFLKEDVRFFVEAKKPSVDIGTPDNCFQTLRYGFSAKTPLAVLTDFEQFHILDCRYKPNKRTATAQTLRKYHFTDYANKQKFAEIFNLFSREAVAGDSLEKYAGTLPKKRGYQEFDDAFLADLDQYRDTLARAFKNQNPDLDGEKLTEITQRTLDRLVFMRFLEDKQIHSENLVANFGDKGTAWQDFVAASRKLDGIYNGIVFKTHAILDVPSFKVDDDAFAGICEELSPANTAYNFNYISIQILGSIYERFLGKVIVTTGKRARVEEKPEVRKAGGVHYTPQYIARYLVENTVGKLIEGKTPAQIAKMAFADISCGSGSILLAAYDLLLVYHRDWFNANPDKAKKAGCVQREDGAWHLSLKQRREILVNNIYGVDIDHQAVEVAQLSLYLKLLEEETTGTAREYQMEFHETLLPSLAKNIVCGNALIGTDILSGELFEPREERKLNRMDFEDRFPHILRRKSSSGELRETPAAPFDYTMPGVPLHGAYSYKKKQAAKTFTLPAIPESEFEGGFDAIIGNPPYIDSEWMTQFLKTEREYCSRKYEAASGNWDIFCVFVERALQVTRAGGLVSLIVPNKLGSASYARGARQILGINNLLLSIRDYSHVRVFPVAVYPIVFVAQKVRASKSAKLRYERMEQNGNDVICVSTQELEYGRYFLEAAKPWQIFSSISKTNIAGKMSSRFPKLDSCATVLGAATVSEAYEIAKLIQDGGRGLKVANSGTIDRFHFLWSERECRYLGRSYLKPIISDACLRKLPTKRLEQAKTPKIIVAGMTLRLECALDLEGEYSAGKSTSVIFPSIHLCYLLGVLNSRAVQYFYSSVFGGNKLQGGYLRVGPPQLREIPIPVLDLSNETEKACHDRMVALVEQMLAAQKQLAAARSDADKDFYGNKCAGLDRQIDALVYELYALTAAEIKIVEGLPA